MDVSVLRGVVFALGSVCCLAVGDIVIVAASGHEPPPSLGTLASMCAGALVGILVTPRPNGRTNGPSLNGTGAPK